MNKRVQQLTIEAFFDESTNGGDQKMYTFGEEKMQLFAELIAQECADIFSHQMKDYRFDEGVHLGLGDVRLTVGMEEDMVQHIKEHFGVEE